MNLMQSKLLKLLAINSVVLLLFAVVLELVGGTWFRKHVQPPEVIPRAGIRHDRRALNPSWGVATRVPAPDYTTTFAAPSSGPIRAGVKPGASEICRILLIGGSTTEERILNENETWSWRLWRDLNQQSPQQASLASKEGQRCQAGYEVINAGVSGHSIVGNYYDLVFWLKRQGKPFDVVVLYQGVNDWHRGFGGRALSEWQHNVIYGVFYHSAVYKVVRGFQALGQGLFSSRNAFPVIKLKKYVLENPRVHALPLPQKLILGFKRQSGSLDHRRYIQRVLNESLTLSRSGVVVITQGVPRCDLRDRQYLRYLSDQKVPDLRVKPAVESSWLALSKQDFLGTALGRCLRLRLVRDNYVDSVAALPESQRSKVKVVDYASLNGLMPNAMTYDDYHADPETSRRLYADFIRLGLLSKIRHLLDT